MFINLLQVRYVFKIRIYTVFLCFQYQIHLSKYLFTSILVMQLCELNVDRKKKKNVFVKFKKASTSYMVTLTFNSVLIVYNKI